MSNSASDANHATGRVVITRSGRKSTKEKRETPRCPISTWRPDPMAAWTAVRVGHSRRGELHDAVHPRDHFLDGFLPELPGLHELYYPDGQILEEDYVYGSFLLSRMNHSGGRDLSQLPRPAPRPAAPRRQSALPYLSLWTTDGQAWADRSHDALTSLVGGRGRSVRELPHASDHVHAA